MDAPLVTARPAWPPASIGPSHYVRAGLFTYFAFVSLAALVVLLRRATGALADPLPPATLLAAGIALALAGLAYRAAAAGLSMNVDGVPRATWAVPTAVLAIGVFALSLVDTPPLGLIALWGPVAIEEVASWNRFFREHRRLTEVAPPTSQVAPVEPPRSPGISLLVEDEVEAEIDPGVWQQMSRRTEDDGVEIIDGFVRVEFVAGQRHATTHLAICPPLPAAPRCFAEPSDGPSAQVKIAQALAYGVRLEIKLDEPAEEATLVVVEFSIQSP